MSENKKKDSTVSNQSATSSKSKTSESCAPAAAAAAADKGDADKGVRSSTASAGDDNFEGPGLSINAFATAGGTPAGPADQRIPDITVATIGNVDSGKSTLVGVLTKSVLDDGRGTTIINL